MRREGRLSELKEGGQRQNCTRNHDSDMDWQSRNSDQAICRVVQAEFLSLSGPSTWHPSEPAVLRA